MARQSSKHMARPAGGASRRAFALIAAVIGCALLAIAIMAILGREKPEEKTPQTAYPSTVEASASAEPSSAEASVESGAPERKAVFSAADEALLAQAKAVPELDELLACEDLNFDLLPRAVMAMREKGLSAADAVALVKAGGDHVPAEDIDWSALYEVAAEPVENPSSLTALANKRYALGPDYEPDDLVTLPVGYYGASGILRQEAADAAVALIDGAVGAGYGDFFAMSNYRSYHDQGEVYGSYVANYGQASADRYSARAGYSDHQTGLATDFGCLGAQISDFNEYAGYSWVLEHAADYGYILRYPKDREFITGYEYENWHFRYVGVEAARIIADHGWTLEEYRILFD